MATSTTVPKVKDDRTLQLFQQIAEETYGMKLVPKDNPCKNCYPLQRENEALQVQLNGLKSQLIQWKGFIDDITHVVKFRQDPDTENPADDTSLHFQQNLKAYLLKTMTEYTRLEQIVKTPIVLEDFFKAPLVTLTPLPSPSEPVPLDNTINTNTGILPTAENQGPSPPPPPNITVTQSRLPLFPPEIMKLALVRRVIVKAPLVTSTPLPSLPSEPEPLTVNTVIGTTASSSTTENQAPPPKNPNVIDNEVASCSPSSANLIPTPISRSPEIKVQVCKTHTSKRPASTSAKTVTPRRPPAKDKLASSLNDKTGLRKSLRTTKKPVRYVENSSSDNLTSAGWPSPKRKRQNIGCQQNDQDERKEKRKISQRNDKEREGSTLMGRNGTILAPVVPPSPPQVLNGFSSDALPFRYLSSEDDDDGESSCEMEVERDEDEEEEDEVVNVSINDNVGRNDPTLAEEPPVLDENHQRKCNVDELNLNGDLNEQGDGNGEGDMMTPIVTTGSPRRVVGIVKPTQKVYGFILAMADAGEGVKRIFGIGKRTINIGRGSKNDIRINAPMFSRFHVTLLISEERDGGGLKVELRNQSKQKNATLAPCVVPFEGSVLLDSPSIFLLQGRRIQWVENMPAKGTTEKLAKLCSHPILYIFEKSTSANQIAGIGGGEGCEDQEDLNPNVNVVEYAEHSVEKRTDKGASAEPAEPSLVANNCSLQ